jgi:hypothetical protein
MIVIKTELPMDRGFGTHRVWCIGPMPDGENVDTFDGMVFETTAVRIRLRI